MSIAVGPIPSTGGVRTHIEGLVAHSRHRSSLIHYSRWSPFYPGYRGLGSTLHRNSILPRWDPYGAAYARLILRRSDVVHTHAHPVWPSPYATNLGPARVHTVHQIYERDDATDDRHWRLLNRLNEEMIEVCRRVRSVVAVSRSLAEDLRDRYKVDSMVIPNGIDFEPAPAPEPALPAGLESNGYFLFVGHMGAVKRPGLFIELARTLKDRPFAMAGPGTTREGIAAAFGDVPSNLVPLGPTDNRHARWLMRNARCVVQTSARESASIVLLEALAEGTKLVAPELRCNQELLPAEVRLFAVDDLSGLVRLARAAWNAPRPSPQTIEQLRRRHDIRRTAKEVDDLYTVLVGDAS